MDLEEKTEAKRNNMRRFGFLTLCCVISLCGVMKIKGNPGQEKDEAGIGDLKTGDFSIRQNSDIRLSKHQKHEESVVPPTSNATQLQKTVKSMLTEVLTFTWDNGVVHYTIDDSYSDESKRLIDLSIADFVGRVNANSTKAICIKFKKIDSNQTDMPENYVNFFPGNKCDSTVGRPFDPNKHNVSIGLDCMTHGVIQHELLHILGFWHEQSRTDRDKYITILWDNVLEGARENFRQYSDPVDDHLGLPYDYGSIMHYQFDAFSKNGNATIIPNYTSKEAIGQRARPSMLDLIKVRLRYECMKHQNESTYRDLLEYPIPLYADDNAPDQPLF